jgi:CheY-like chemotaxis protein
MEFGNLHILLVEDDEVDILTFQRALRKLQIQVAVTIAHDGLEALRIMRGAAGQAPLSRPYIVLADLNMPRMNGLELLAEIRKDPHLHSIPVFVLSTSRHPADLAMAHSFHVAGYLRKPHSFEEYQHSIAKLFEYLSLCQFI